MTVTPLKTPQTPRRDDDPLRAQLAQALEAAREAREVVDRQRAAIERTRSSVAAADKAVTVAEKGVEEARAAHAQALADAAAGDAAPPISGMRAARQAVVDAQDEVEAAKGALAQLKGTLPDFEAELREADIAVEAEISKILAVAVQELMDQAAEIARELLPLRRALLAFVMNDSPPRVSDRLAFDRGRQPLREAQAAVDAFFQAYDSIEDSQIDVWAFARKQLRADPHAPLPDVASPPPN